MQMKVLSLAKYALTITTGAALLAACGNKGGSSLAPSGATAGPTGIAHLGRAAMLDGVLVTAAHPNLGAQKPVRSHPAKSMKSGFYQYISDFGTGTILEFDYPKGDTPIGSIAAGGGECTRNGRGTFWVAVSSELEEFKVGGTSPIRVLKPGGESCAIDRASGDIATSNLSNGGIIIFRHGRGKGKVYYGSGLIETFFAGYDDSGNLFVDGFSDGGAFGLVELPKGSSTFETITVSNSVGFPGAVQWDGKYLTVGDQENHVIFRYAVSGTMATLKGTVSLSGSSDCDQTWIAKTLVFCPDAGNVDAEVYKYPAGGYPIATLTGSFSEPIAAVQVAK
jgi:hypothetical protein